MSKSGSLYGVVMQRIGGYTGSIHDSGNILGMSSVYFLVKYFIRIKKSDLFFFCIALLGLLMTQSTTNIIVSFFVMTIFYLYILTKKFNMRLLMLGGVALVIIAFIVPGEFIQVLFSRIIDDEARAGMYNQLSVEQLLSALPIMFVGHGNDLVAQYMQIEIGLMKIVYQLGVFHACLLFLILLFPSYLFFKEFKISKDNMLLLPPLAVNIFGFLSLLHYGSLLRSTSIFLYFMISAMFIIIYYKHRFIPLKQYVR